MSGKGFFIVYCFIPKFVFTMTVYMFNALRPSDAHMRQPPQLSSVQIMACRMFAPKLLSNAGILLIGPPGTNFKIFVIIIHTFSFMKIHFKILYGKWQPFCLGLNVLSMLCLPLDKYEMWTNINYIHKMTSNVKSLIFISFHLWKHSCRFYLPCRLQVH